MMRSLFYEKQLVDSKFSISNFVKCAQSRENLEEDSQEEIQTEEGTNFEEAMTRAQAAKSFEEFYRQNLSEVRYEMQMHQARLL